jgi:FkbM family methyltransferase
MQRIRAAIAWSASVSSLAPGPASRAWFFLAAMLLPVKHRFRPRLAMPVRIRLGTGSTRFWFSDSSELFALYEIFAEGEYAAARERSPETIVDLGANVGQAALWLRSVFPDARIVSVEPDPETFAKLQRNLGHDPRVTLQNAAITARDGGVSMVREPNSSWGTRISTSSAPAAVQVAGVSLDSLLTEHDVARVDLLKVDIEGLEHEALCDSPALRQTEFVIGEIHADLLDVSTAEALEDMRRCGGFDRYELDGDIFVLVRDDSW